jgi:SOS-response transcriptional repressor LexA
MDGETIGQRIKRLRKLLGITQAELARRAGVAPQTLNGIEQDQRAEPSPFTLVPIARELRVTLGYLVTSIDDANIRLPPPRSEQELAASMYQPVGDDPVTWDVDQIEVKVRGDCMATDILPGDWVRIDRHAPRKVGSVLVLVHQGEMTMKRIRRKNGRWLLVPDNPAYAPIEVDPDNTTIFGVVVGTYRESPQYHEGE